LRVTARLLHLDNLKIVLTTGVIVAHAAMTYGAVGTWVYEEPSLSHVGSVILGALVGVGVTFGLGLFFLIAGLLTAAPLARRGPRRFLASRLGRLGVPLAAYAVIVWPMLRWTVDRVQGDRQSLVGFYRAAFGRNHWQSLGTGPLWFVAILLVVTTGWSLWRWARPASPAGDGDLEMTHLAIAAGTTAVGTFIVRIWFPIDSPQFLDLHVWLWPQSSSMFVLGAISGERDWQASVPDAMRRLCRRGVVGAGVVLGVMILLSSGPDAFKGGWHWEAAGYAACEGVFSVGVSLLVLDYFRRHHSGQSLYGRRLADAAYGAFVAQGPVLVLIALVLRPVDVAGDVKFLLLAPAAVIGSFALATGAVALNQRRGRQLAAQRGIASDQPPGWSG